MKKANIALNGTLVVMHGDVSGFGVFSQGQARN